MKAAVFIFRELFSETYQEALDLIIIVNFYSTEN